jgi:hypothetical protein
MVKLPNAYAVLITEPEERSYVGHLGVEERMTSDSGRRVCGCGPDARAVSVDEPRGGLF